LAAQPLLLAVAVDVVAVVLVVAVGACLLLLARNSPLLLVHAGRNAKELPPQLLQQPKDPGVVKD
jgi:hypothetical protein